MQRERAVGCFWDVDASKGYERVWVYGASWIAMFDLGQDLPGHAHIVGKAQQQQTVEQQLQLQINGTTTTYSSSSDEAEPVDRSLESRITLPQSISTTTRKRKHSLDPELAATQALNAKRATALTQNLTAARSVLSGAGSKILKGAEKDSAGIREAKLRKYDKKGREIVSDLSASGVSRSTAELDGEDGESELEGEDGDDMDIDDDMPTSRRVQTSKQDGQNANKNKPFHMITRYRPILGIIPLSKQDEWENQTAEEADYEPSDVSLEVAVVERPGWELDLGERFVGKNEKDV